MKTNLIKYILTLSIVSLISCKQEKEHSHEHDSDGHTHEHAVKETFSIDNLVKEVKTIPDSIVEYLHAQHHAHKVLERRTVPPGYETKNLKNWKDYASKVEDLPVINPGPGEYVHVMEGYKNGYKNSSNWNYRNFSRRCATYAYT